jgi:hypothetical protein
MLRYSAAILAPFEKTFHGLTVIVSPLVSSSLAGSRFGLNARLMVTNGYSGRRALFVRLNLALETVRNLGEVLYAALLRFVEHGSSDGLRVFRIGGFCAARQSEASTSAGQKDCLKRQAESELLRYLFRT